MTTILTPLKSIAKYHSSIKVFLAGSMDRDWQNELIQKWNKTVANNFPKAITFVNPRRKDWDSTWKNSYRDSNFYQQTKWELSTMKQCDYIVVHLTKASQAPISLLELGLHAHTGKVLLLREDGFWKEGNIDIVCEEYGIKQFDQLDDIIAFLQIASTK